MQTTKLSTIYISLALLAATTLGCQQRRDGNDGIASTHPALAEQLENDSVEMPISDNENPPLYQRYRITMEQYQNSGSYDVGTMYAGKLAPLDESSHSDARTFRTVLNQALSEGVNFAGKYTVATVGCGTGCQTHYVIDRESGKVLDKLQGSVGASYSPDSRLFILNAPDSTLNYADCPSCEPQAYEFVDGKFKKLPTPTP